MAKKQSIKDDFISFKDLIEQPEVKEKFKEMLGEKNGIAFLQSALQVVQKNPEMLKAESNSLLNAFSAIASLNLLVDPSFGQAFIDVYKLKDGFIWRTLAQFQIGYKGLIELGHRTNQFYIINSIDVREGEFKKIDRMTGEIEFDWIQDQDERKKQPLIGFVAFFQLTNGFRKSWFMTIKEMQDHGKKWSKNFREKDNGWQKDFEGMGKKTALKLLLDKYAPKSVEMQRAISFDQAIINDINGQSLNYADNPNTKQKVDIEENNRNVQRQSIIDHIKNAKKIEVLEQCFEHIPDDEIRLMYDEKKKKLTNK